MIDFVWNNVMFSITDIGGGVLKHDIPSHAHAKNSYELHFITKGSGRLVANDAEYTIKRGNMFITGPGVYHSQATDIRDPVEDVFIMLQASGTDKANFISQTFLNRAFYFSRDFDNAKAREILKEYREKKPDFKSVIGALAAALLTIISRGMLPDNFVEIPVSDNLNDRRFVIIEQEFLYADKITLRSLSEKIGVCERQTQRLLKKYYGKSFREKKRESARK